VSYVTDSFDDEVVALLQAGGVGLLPTDTIYGLSCRALSEGAVNRVRHLKGRDNNKPLIVLISDIEMLKTLRINPHQADVVKPYWPGPLSLEFRAAEAPPWLHRGLEHFAIRLPDNDGLRELVRKTGPIISTSANLQGDPPVNSVPAARTIFGDQIDFYVDAGKLNNPSSTLAVVNNGKLEVVRPGAVKIS
jgi:L-threonylcarbamoyladenylate synthase